MRGGHDLADQHADRGTGGPEPGQHEHQHGGQADADLDQEVGRQRPVGAVGLQQAAVEGEQHEECRRGEDRRDADAALLVEQHRHAMPAHEHEHGPGQDEHGALAVHTARPAAHQLRIPALAPDGHPAHDGDHHRRARHGEDQVQPRELIEDSVAVRREQAGQHDGEHHAGPVGQHAGGRERARLQQPGPHRLDARARVGVEEEFRAEVRSDRVGCERHGGGHGLHDDLGRRRLLRLRRLRCLRPVTRGPGPPPRPACRCGP